MRPAIALPVLLLVLAPAGMMAQTAPEALIPGIIDFGESGTDGVLSAPEKVRVGENFSVTIMTYGGGCEREGDTSVILSATGADLIVYDVTSATHPQVMCAAVLKRLRHHVTLTFEKPGEALLRVWGRRVAADTPPLGAPALVERRITIQ